MRSSSGAYSITLDHVRALAAFMVVTWHFTHATTGYPIPFNYVPSLFPFAILDEGYTGVALFMTLSGYLFAKLLGGKSIHYGAFFWNRALRLLPLLLLVLLLVGIQQFLRGNLATYARLLAMGALFPTLPNGAWSLTVEFHFYLILPMLLWMSRKSKLLPLSVIAAAIMLRCLLYYKTGEIQSLAYWTIIGRIDQFALGMLAYQFRTSLTNRHALAISIAAAFMGIYWLFDSWGGFFLNPSYPSPSPFWIFLPTLEGIAYSAVIAWYDNSFTPSTTGVSRFVGHLGEYSYSIYLFHIFIVFDAARFTNEHIMPLTNFYVACLWSMIFFVLMVIPGYISFRFIEAPFLKLRRRYIAQDRTV